LSQRSNENTLGVYGDDGDLMVMGMMLMVWSLVTSSNKAESCFSLCVSISKIKRRMVRKRRVVRKRRMVRKHVREPSPNSESRRNI
jgi:CII-binding regulator of phage lambda lysogenization HflD